MIVYAATDRNGQPVPGWTWATSYLPDAPTGNEPTVGAAFEAARRAMRPEDQRDNLARDRQYASIGA